MTGFNFLIGIAAYSRGNVYFCDTRLKRIYKGPAGTNISWAVYPASFAQYNHDKTFRPMLRVATTNLVNITKAFYLSSR